MAFALSSQPIRLTKAPLTSRATRARVVCSAIAPEENTSRRSVFALVAATVAGVAASEAQANVGNPKNSSIASSEGYTLEGTKKQGISASKKRKLLAKARERAEKQSAK